MKRRYYAYIGSLCSLLVFTGCDKESVTPDTEEKVPITLSASSFPVSVDVQARSQTRAESLNTRTIGIVAVKATSNALNDVTSWTDYYYLDHVRATGTDTDLNGEKEVAFAQPQYWPFNPAEYLAFVAYSPYSGTGGDARVTRITGTNTLKVSANSTESFPDFLYTEPVGAFNKETAKANPDKAVSLGEFQHAMAKLDIEVKLVDKDGKPIPESQFPNPNQLRITELKVLTKVKNGEFDLLQTTSPKVWTSLDGTGTEQIVRTHISSPITLTADLSTYTDCFLLPGTQDNSYVSITIQELNSAGTAPISTIIKKAKITEFEVVPGIGATLEMGKTTKLTIKVKYVPIPDPETGIILEGQLVEWDYKGKSTVTIE